MRLWVSRFLDKDATGGGGNAPSLSDEDLQKKIEAIINRQGGGDPMAAIGILLKDNADVRAKNRKLAEELTQAKPFIVNAEDSKILTEFKKLGKTLEELQRESTELTTLRETQQRSTFKELVSTAAKAHGWNSEVLEDQITLRGMHVEMKDVHVKNGDKTEVRRVPYVRPKSDASAPLQSAEEWVATLPKPYLDALKVGTQDTGESAQGTTVVTQFPSQSSADRQGQPRLVDNLLKTQYVPPKVGITAPTATQGA
jgi:hypothetical protein